MTITLENLKAAEPLAEQLLEVREALREMNKAPARLRVYNRLVGHSEMTTARERDIKIPNDVARCVLVSEESRLVAELAALGVRA